MPPPSTVYTFDLSLSDSERSVYEDFRLTVALHPSETLEFMVVRILAYCLEYEEGITFSKGLGEPDEPAVSIRYLDGRLKSWIEVGVPDVDRLHKAAKTAERVAVYAHRSPAVLFEQATAMKRLHRAEEIPVFVFDARFLTEFAQLLQRRNVMSVAVAGQEVYLTIGNRTLTSPIRERRLASD